MKYNHVYIVSEGRAEEDKGVTCTFSNLHTQAKRPVQDQGRGQPPPPPPPPPPGQGMLCVWRGGPLGLDSIY